MKDVALTLALPLPWTWDSGWLLIQLGVQVSLVVVVILAFIMAIALIIVRRNDAEGYRHIARNKADQEKEALQRAIYENERIWREDVSAILNRILDKLNYNSSA